MPLFTKKIIQPGTYVVDRKDGSKSRVYISPDRLNGLVANFKKMKESGLKIPAPWRHDPKAVPVRLDRDKEDVDSYNNAGFWKDFWVEDGALYGKLEVKNRTDASKVGRNVTECSPILHPNWVDGNGTEYGDSITHCALVTHPIVNGQENFVPVDDDGQPAIALSQDAYLAAMDVSAIPFSSDLPLDHVSGNEGFDNQEKQGPSADIRTVVQSMRLVGIPLPDDTTMLNLAERIVVATQAFVAGKEQSDDFMASQSPTKRPKNSREQPSPIVMSKEFENIAAYLNGQGLKTTDDQDFTVDFLQGLTPAEPAPEPAPFSKAQEALLNAANQKYKDGLKSQIEKCVQLGKCHPRFAQERLVPLLEVAQFSVDEEGNQVPTTLDAVLEVVTDIPDGAFLTGKSPTTVRKSKANLFGVEAFSLEGLNEEDGPDMDTNPETEEPVTEEQADELSTLVLDAAGISHS